MDEDVTTWREALTHAMTGAEDPGPVVALAPDEATFDIKFDAGYGGTNGRQVLAWTATRVYFPVCYDGSEWLGSAPRNPVTEGQYHEGGG
jgi:hypothetical protein